MLAFLNVVYLILVNLMHLVGLPFPTHWALSVLQKFLSEHCRGNSKEMLVNYDAIWWMFWN